MMIIGNPKTIPINHRPIEESLHKMVELGFDGLEVCTSEIEMCVSDDLRKKFGEYAESLGLKFVRYNSMIPPYFDTLLSREQTPEIIAGFKKDIEVTRALGVNQLLTWEGRIPSDATSKDIHGWIFDKTVKIFREVIAYGDQREVSISLEVHPFSLGIDVDFLVNLCDAVDSENFGVTYDCAHFAVGHPDSYIDIILKLGSRIKHLHFCDSDKKTPEIHYPPGKGCMDLDGVVKALEQINFSGSLMFDSWLYPFPDQCAKLGIEYLRRAMKNLDIAD